MHCHRCRCVSNAILTTCTNIIHNWRLNKTQKKPSKKRRKKTPSRLYNACIYRALFHSFSHPSIIPEWGARRKKNSYNVQLFFSLSPLFVYLYECLYAHMHTSILLYEIVMMRSHFVRPMKMMEAVYYFDLMKSDEKMMMKKPAIDKNQNCKTLIRKQND